MAHPTGFRRLFFDIETSYCEGWFWRPSFKTQIGYEQIIKEASMICICYKWQGSDKIYSMQWDKGEDKEMAKKFYDVLLEADEVVGHNGDRFDLKWLRTRFLIHGIKSIPVIKSVDTLKISRSQFNFPSNRLDAIGKYLGFGGKKEHKGIELWHDIIQRNNKRAMGEMIAYCKRDVELLEKVYLKLEGYAKSKTHIGVDYGNGKCSCPSCASENTRVSKYRTSAAGTKTVQLHCEDCGKYNSVSLTAYTNEMLINKGIGKKK